MSTIHIATGDGHAAVLYDEDKVRTMLQQGILRDDAFYWREGMSDWQPLHTLFGPISPPPPPTPLRSKSPLNQPVSANPAGPIRIEGWLTVFCVTLTILTPLATIGIMNFYWDQAQEGLVAYPLLRGVCIWENLGSMVLMVYGFVVGCMMLSGSPRGREIAKRFLIIRLFAFMGVEIFALIMMKNLPSTMFKNGISGVVSSVFQALVFTAVWWLYFKNSKRVKTTYGIENSNIS